MATLDCNTVTKLLQDWHRGDQEALEKLLPLVYRELYRRADFFMKKEHPGHTLQPTALINETYLRLVDSAQVSWQSRNEFYAVCANLMRQILVDYARSSSAEKRGGKVQQVALNEALVVSDERGVDLGALDDALNALASLSPRQSKVVELRYFGGLTVEETADVLKVSPDTVMRDWKLAKVWLLQTLSKGS